VKARRNSKILDFRFFGCTGIYAPAQPNTQKQRQSVSKVYVMALGADM
jgi:hypothetical protein